MPGRFECKIIPVIDASDDKIENSSFFFSACRMPLLRPSRDEDIAAITAIYTQHVLHGTFETEPPSTADMATRRIDVLSKELPYLVAEQDGNILGFAYGNWFKPRQAYRYSIEDSVYLAPGLDRKVMAIIGDSANAGWVGVHRAVGFKQVGIVEACGWKFGA